MLFTEVNMLDRFQAAADAGFRAVEIQRPYEHPREDLARRLRESGVSCVLLNLPLAPLGEGGLACTPGRESEFRHGVKTAIEYARALDCPLMNCPAADAPRGVPLSQVRATYVANLRYAADSLAEEGVGLVVEPLNTTDVPRSFLRTSKQARSIITDVGSANMGLQHDLYHMQIMEGDLSRGIERNLEVIRHVQIADNPGRHEPGTGETNIPFLLDRLDEIGYSGWVGCEYIPSSTTADSLRWASRWLG